jgi:hypothetical protein
MAVLLPMLGNGCTAINYNAYLMFRGFLACGNGFFDILIISKHKLINHEIY